MRVMRVCTAIFSRLFGTRATWFLLLAFLLATAVPGTGVFRSHAQSPAQLTGPDAAVVQAPAAVSAQAAVSAPVAVSDRPVLQAAANAAPTGPQEQIAQLMQMATDLKVAVDKTNKDELSVNVVRKASAIEQLAHKVRNGWPQKDR